MTRTPRLLLSALAVLLLASGCGSKQSGGGAVLGPTPPGGGGGSGPISMTLDGTPWTADALASGLGVSVASPGLYVITGYRTVGTASSFVTLTLFNIGGTGTYPLGVNMTNFGGWLTVGDAASAWWTPLTGSAGTVTITTLTSTRIAGTFACTLDSLSGAAHGHRTVTAGTFDMPIVSNTAGPLPANAGSSLGMLRDGTPWNAATIANLTMSNVFVVTAASDDATVSLVMGAPSAPGTYPLTTGPTGTRLTLTNAAATASWGGTSSVGPGGTSVPNDSGAVVITSVTAARVRGTFQARLAPSIGAAGDVRFTAGSFDIGRPATSAPARAFTPEDARRLAIASLPTPGRH